ncbi:MAG TPA: twin-arginine translocase subunit TatC [Thermoplasmataceae archaeon]|nr:twin-arginine translocase subunit TatC [Thermoplasmatales archaeon AK]HLH86063.1 twin-arginine translocase subunit TatC [Thermoplasmataceae archaeon]
MSDDNFLHLISRNIDEIRFRFLRILEFFGVFFVLFLITKVTYYNVLGHTIPFLSFDVYQNIGSQTILALAHHVLPSGTQLLVLKPTDGVAADIYMCIFLAVVVSMPYIIFHILRFLGPALHKNERELIRVILFPASFLFLAGSFMGVWVVTPALFRIFNDFNIGLGASPTMSVLSFTSFVLIYVLIFGVAFEVPVFMYGLTRARLVPASYWMRNWRWAVVISLIFGLIFSPGVLGVTMVLMALPMIALYFIGAYFSGRYEKLQALEEASKSVSESLQP